jgi:GH24 family phage-related lysozyme (muramidase)|tara:strand:+ start:6701 stop:7528 length:828 start_codon:yes stop_codon:yes gene_type:complete
MEVSPPAIVIIQDEEVFKDTAYDDARPDYVLKPGDKIIGTLTIGYGHTNAARNDDDIIKIGDTVTEEEAKEILIQDLQQYVDIVNNRMKSFNVELTQSQFDGLVFATMNRPEKMSGGNLWRAIGSGDENKIREVWSKTISKSVKNFPGLEERKENELDLFFSTESEIEVEEQNLDRGIPEPSETFIPYSLPVVTKEPKVDNSEINMIWTDLYNNLANAFIDNPRTARERELFGRDSISYKAKDKPVKVEYDSKEKQKIAEIYSGMLRAISESLKR